MQTQSPCDPSFCHGEILEYSPPRMLVYDQPLQTTAVSWVLTATKGGNLSKSHTPRPCRDAVARKPYASGWAGVLGLLREFLEKGSRAARSGIMLANKLKGEHCG